MSATYGWTDKARSNPGIAESVDPGDARMQIRWLGKRVDNFRLKLSHRWRSAGLSHIAITPNATGGYSVGPTGGCGGLCTGGYSYGSPYISLW